MAWLEPELLRAVAPARTRLLAQYGLRWALYALAGGLGACATLLWAAAIASRIWPDAAAPALLSAGRLAAPVGAVVALLVLGLGAWRRPRLPEVARRVDGAGLEERLTTCLEFAGQAHPLLEALRADTLRALQAVDWPRALPWRAPTGALVAGALCGALLLIPFLLPPAAHQQFRPSAVEPGTVAEEVARIEAALQRAALAAEERGALTGEIAAVLEKLRQELRQARTVRDALDAIGRGEESLAQLGGAAAHAPQALQEAASSLMQTPETEALGESLSERRLQEASQQMEQLAADLGAMAPDAQQAAASALADAAARFQEAGGEMAALASALADAAQALLEGDIQGASEALGEAAEALVLAEEALEMPDQEADGLALLQQELEAARDALGAVAGATPGDGQTIGITGGGQEGNDGGKGGQISSDVGGSGASSMEGTATRPSRVGEANPGGQGDPPDARGAYSQVFDPSPRLGTDGQATLLQGQADGDGGATQFETSEGKVAAGQFRPYDQVFAQYEEQAMQSMARVELPPGVQELVKSYFSALDPANDGAGGAR